MKKWLLFLSVLVILLATCLTSSASAADTEDSYLQRVYTQDFRVKINPLEVKVIKWPEYEPKPGEEIQVIVKVKNHSSLIEEVTYDLGSEHGLGGISAVIDYDGPLGPKAPEEYNWNKVPVRPGEEQYIYVSFPVPAVYDDELTFHFTVDRWLGPRLGPRG